MRRPRRTLKTTTAAEKRVPVLMVVPAPEYATPWDEPARDWGRRGYGLLPAIRKAFRREKLLGTW